MKSRELPKERYIYIYVPFHYVKSRELPKERERERERDVPFHHVKSRETPDLGLSITINHDTSDK